MDQLTFCNKLWSFDAPEAIKQRCIEVILLKLMQRGFSNSLEEAHMAMKFTAMVGDYIHIDRLLLLVRQLPNEQVEKVITDLLSAEKKEGEDLDFLSEYPDIKLYMCKKLMVFYVKPLKQERGPKPVESWRLPEASLDHPGLLSFMHNDQQNGVIQGFSDRPFTCFQDARQFVQQYQRHCFSCVLTPAGRGKTAVVEASKTKEYFKRRILKYGDLTVKIQNYMYKSLGLLQPPKDAPKRKLSEIPGSANPPKKKRAFGSM
mmetsp:Transcript_1212/g.1513  ORF Transcript_1212/g.1513 Transcript_1212/m.1513 type:complete len:260 (-) Transcript_1212:4-783(-)